jgi:hypothetical protein
MANLRANRITSTEVFETTGSVQFPPSITTALSVPAGTDFAYGTEPFTIECFIYAPTLAATPGALYSDHIIFSQTVSGTNYLYFAFEPDGTLYWTNTTSGGGTPVESAAGSIVAGKWQHIVACRDSNNILRLFVDGIVVYSGTNTFDFNNTTYNPTIGNYTHGYNALPFTGHISNFRILKGTALYTKNFTPPTRELTAIPNTVLLCCQSTTRANEERTGKTITVNGNAVANELTPGLLTDRVKSGGSSAITGSVEFDGTGDYLLDSTGADGFNGGVGDWTVESWMYCTDASQSDVLVNGLTSSTDRFYINFIGQTLYVGDFNINNIAIGGVKQINSWFHIAVTKSGSTYRAFINGVLIGSSTESLLNSTLTSLQIGYRGSQNYYTKGFISNLRIVKGTAVYTSNFIPPTRELKKLPGTVLLCCKNSNDPTAEETGKTITGYGSLVYNPPELVTDGGFSSASNWPSRGADWTISGGVATINSANSGFDFLGILAPGINGLLYEFKFDISNWTAGRLELSQADSSNIQVPVTGNGSYTFRFLHTGTTNGNIGLYSYTDTTASFNLDNISLKVVPSVPKPPFIPQIGSDGTVEFTGPTKINTPNYFYLSTGTTEQRSRGRGLFGGGYVPGGSTNAIDFINIQSSGISQDFGDLSNNMGSADGKAPCAAASSSRALFASGYTAPAPVNTVEYVTIATASNSTDFGDLSQSRRDLGACASSTRATFGGGTTTGSTSATNIIDYVTIASIGNAVDYGDLTQARRGASSCSSPTRGIWGGGYVSSGSSTYSNTIDYVTISSTGNATDFGDLTIVRGSLTSCSNSTRGIFAGGTTYTAPASTYYNTIDYITISSTGNAADFGDLSTTKHLLASASSSTRGTFAGGGTSYTNTIEYVTILSTGNATDFGDLTVGRISYNGGCSNGHGGLG